MKSSQALYSSHLNFKKAPEKAQSLSIILHSMNISHKLTTRSYKISQSLKNAKDTASVIIWKQDMYKECMASYQSNYPNQIGYLAFKHHMNSFYILITPYHQIRAPCHTTPCQHNTVTQHKQPCYTINIIIQQKAGKNKGSPLGQKTSAHIIVSWYSKGLHLITMLPTNPHHTCDCVSVYSGLNCSHFNTIY